MVKAVVGANWGDEGKGKITDMLAEKADIIVRFQGGAKADYMVFDRYSAPDYSQSSYVQGVERMYGEMVFMKVEE